MDACALDSTGRPEDEALFGPAGAVVAASLTLISTGIVALDAVWLTCAAVAEAVFLAARTASSGDVPCVMAVATALRWRCSILSIRSPKRSTVLYPRGVIISKALGNIRDLCSPLSPTCTLNGSSPRNFSQAYVRADSVSRNAADRNIPSSACNPQFCCPAGMGGSRDSSSYAQ